MKISFKCFLSVVSILIFNHSFLSIVRTTELNPTKSDERDKLDVITDHHKTKPGIHQSSAAEIHSSFSEETSFGGEKEQSLSGDKGESSVIQNIDVSPELSETTDAVVFTLIDTAAELKNRAEPVVEDEIQNSTKKQLFIQPEEVYIVRAEPKTQAQVTIKELEVKEVNESSQIGKSSQEETTKTAPQHEDIPSFREWTQKQLAEAERKKFDQNSTTEKLSKSSGKFRIKNYASPDCGAKIVSANPESVSSSSVLSSSKDEYMLNYCTNRIWFVVELCEAIQAKQLDLANFELFSSSPKDFAVSISHRFPTRDWSNVGKFTAKDSRDIQTFNLNPHLFGRYIKVELMSHYGREQFCPISWVGVFGTSEFEVLAKEDERHDEDDEDEDLLVGQRRDAPKNLFISATDAVLSIVKQATAPFMKSESNDTRVSSRDASDKSNATVNCVTPRHIIVCDNCSQSFYDEVFNLISCRARALTELVSCPFVRKSLVDGETCRRYGLDFSGLRSGAPFPANRAIRKKETGYLTALLQDSFVAGLCNVFAAIEGKVVVNASDDPMQTLKNLTEMNASCPSVDCPESTRLDPECSGTSSSDSKTISNTKNTRMYFLTEILRPSERFTEKIEPTRTLEEAGEEKGDIPSAESPTTMETTQAKATTQATVRVTQTATVDLQPPPSSPPGEADSVEGMDAIVRDTVNGTNGTNPDSTFDSILSDINEFEKAVHSNPALSLPRDNNLPTESIFLRLANRIKNLEINMSLSSTYLEELSRRYRNQLEMLSKTINSTAQKIEERYRLEEERERLREKEILLLRLQLANLTRDVSILLREKNSWRPRASSISQHVVLVSIEIFFVWAIFSCWKRGKDEPKSVTIQIRKRVKRRKSLEGVTGHNLPVRRKRRPSEEALEIAVSRNRNILERKKKRRKKDSKCSINLVRGRARESEEEASVVTATATQVPPASEVGAVTLPDPGPDEKPPPIHERIPAPPGFIRTAMSSRNYRMRISQQPEREINQETVKSQISVEPPPREKKSSGTSLKKYMKKFFDK